MTTPEDTPDDAIEEDIDASDLPPQGQTESTDAPLASDATVADSEQPSGAATDPEDTTDPEDAPTVARSEEAPAGASESEEVPAAAESEEVPAASESEEVPAASESEEATAAAAQPDAPGPRRPSAHPIPSMLGSGLESRSWLLELPEFEGPLDLLLHLVRRHELDILDIPTSFVTEKYLEYLAFMEAMDLEVAGDYLVMAATLAYLKSRELVPTEPSEEDEIAVSDAEGPDPREELIARLLEYQKFRAAASDLDKLPVSGRDVFSRGGEVELPPVDPGLAPLTLFRLAEAYHRVLDRARIHKSHDVVIETCSVAQRMHQLTTILIESSKVEFESLFLGRTWSSEAELRSMLVVTLMSVLELTKLGVIFVRQEVGGDAIMIERKATPEEAKRAIAGYDESISFGAPKPGVAEDPASGEGPDSPPAAGAQTPSEDAESNSDA